MTCFICATCGTQFSPSAGPPPRCPICDDERQYVPQSGQNWTTLERLRASHGNTWRVEEPGLFSLATSPSFGIGQRALLIQAPTGNVLWDCIALIDGATIALVRALGGISAIAISHPHYYTTMAEWAAAFACPVMLHEADRLHVMRDDPALQFWSGDHRDIAPGLRLINAPGHFDGGTVLHWQAGAEGRGTLLSGDILQVGPDRCHVSFMRSYPNLIPLGAAAVQEIERRVTPYSFDRIYGAFPGRDISTGGRDALTRSVARYCDWINRS